MISDKAIRCPKCGCPTNEKMVQYQDYATPNDTTLHNEEENRSSKWLYGVIALLLTVIAGGGYWWYGNNIGGNNEVKTFVEKFTTAIETKDNISILSMYPDARLADSLSLKIDPNNISITKDDEQWFISLGANRSIVVAKKMSDKSLYIKESHGIFEYPERKLKLAKNTGWYDAKLNDAQNAERLSDEAFITWLKNHIISKVKSNVVFIKNTIDIDYDYNKAVNVYCHGCDYICTHRVVISNKNNFEIPSSDYYISIISDDDDYYDEYKKNKKKVEGKTIPANGTVSYSWKDIHFSGTWDYKDKAILIYNPSVDNILDVLRYSGTEYTEYLTEKSMK